MKRGGVCYGMLRAAACVQSGSFHPSRKINFPPGKLDRAVAARARAQRLCFKAPACATLVRAQLPPPAAHWTRAVSGPRTHLVRHARYSIVVGLRGGRYRAWRGSSRVYYNHNVMQSVDT